VILHLQRFVRTGRPFWDELQAQLDYLEENPGRRLNFDDALRFDYLVRRCSADLARAGNLAGEPQLRSHLESLVARAYAEVNEVRQQRRRWNVRQWFFGEFPATFRRHIRAFLLSLAITIAGAAFGAGAVIFDPPSKQALMPFEALKDSPAERVKREEIAGRDRLSGHKGQFSAQLMTHNIQVAVFTMALGISWGIGSIAVLFYNGVILGAVAADYVTAGFTPFLLGWLLPHGSVEIPAILVGGQAGFIIARAMIGDRTRRTRRQRFRDVSKDVVTLIGGTGIMLVWAGIIEAFFSQYHEPVIPYAVKIAFGVCELAALAAFLLIGKSAQPEARGEAWKSDDPEA